MSDIQLEDWEKRSEDHQKLYKQFLQKANKNKVLKELPDLHDDAFEKVDCMECANCCKNYSPRFKMPDIKRISKGMRMKETEFIDQYLVMDNEGDYVANTAPCPFWDRIIFVRSTKIAPRIVNAFPTRMKMCC